MNIGNIQDSKSFAVKIYFNNGTSEQIKFATESEMGEFTEDLDSAINGRYDLPVVSLILDDGTNIRILTNSFYMFKSFRMTQKSRR